MNRKSTISMYQFTRQLMAIMLSALLIPVALLDLYAQEPAQEAYTPLDATQLDQLVAPVALYPDALVAQVLTASTYPDQVNQADGWLHQNMGLSPDQRAAAVNSMGWDPSVKALTAFPGVLDNLARNSNWTTQLGNAYYNQPEDVMNAVQAMRFQAQQSGTLVSTPQQRVYVDNGAVVIAPVNPDLVYVPYYNPWRVWGPTFAAYPGYYLLPPPPGVVLGLGIGFAAGISIGLFAHYGWGFGAWAPNWRGGGVFYNHGAYYSHSGTVYNHGHFGGYNRGVFEHEGRGVPGGFHAAAARGGVARPEGPRGAPARTAGRPEAPRGAPAGTAGRPEASRGAPARTAGRPEAPRGAPAGTAGRPEASRGAPARTAGRPEAPRGAPAGTAGRPEAPRGAPAGTASRPAPSHAPAAHAAPAAHGNAGHAPAAHEGGKNEHK